jgi:hypothetical protein
MTDCKGLVGNELDKCRNLNRSEGFSLPSGRIIGLVTLLFGVILLWQPKLIVWLLGGLLILIGVIYVISKKTIILPAICVISGIVIIMYPNFLQWAILVIAMLMGFVIAFQEPKTKTKQGIGFAVAVIGAMLFLIPTLLGTLVGVVLILAGCIFLVGGDFADFGWKKWTG